VFSPILGGRPNRSDEEVTEWERQRSKSSEDYDGSPWLTSLVTFSGFVAAFIGSVVVLFVIANLRHGTVWLPYALILGALVAAHLCLRALRYKRRRHARQLAVGDHGRVTGDRRPEDPISPQRKH
jgi:Flp pilus assembly protein TadB